ncbi:MULTISPECIES: hypothetical protein [unclassified Bradyrhizobium]|uniref:hypothetical protein n=1 Tax=unclassified Bradyrhizobium TaxID=2631580 RepID=UPI0028F0E809|nr:MULTISPECIES: hypothetical protein [unclassified Bradyrhizobium]
MPSIIFVHGIGVRAASPPNDSEHPYKATCRVIQNQLFYRQIGWRLVECCWGDDLGAQLNARGKSFPPIKGNLGIEARPEDPARLWELLIEDPSFELRALGAMISELPASGGVAPGQIPPWLALKANLDNFVSSAALTDNLKALDLEVPFATALKLIQADRATSDALAHPQASRAIARAIVAAALRLAIEQGIPPPNSTQVDELVHEVEQLLRQAQLGAVKDYAASAFIGLGTRIATRWGLGQRSNLPGTATPIAGDVIYYQAHGERIRARIHETVTSASEPVALLAHSLGGIASLEALCENAATRKKVRKFITAGSQSGYFYEIDALRTLPYGQPLPVDFPDWLNFWDARDFLSFVTRDVYSGGGSRTDVEVNSGLPFPASHSGYWRQSLTWDKIRAFLAA